MSDLAVEFCGVALEGPVLNASGTFDAIAARRAFGDALLERFPFDAFVTKTVTLAPRQGNPPPRLWETPGGMVNSIGLPNKGLEGFLAQDLPQLAELPVPLVVSVMGFDHQELARLVEAVAARDEVAMLELNVSCPNVETGVLVGADPGETDAAVRAVRDRTAKPLVVKLSPNSVDPAAVARAAAGAGADAVSLINTLKGMPLHPRTREPWLGGRHRRAVRPGGPRGGAGAGRGGGRAPSMYPSWGWAASPRVATRWTSWRWARRWSRWARRASATPPSDAESGPSCPPWEGPKPSGNINQSEPRLEVQMN